MRYFFVLLLSVILLSCSSETSERAISGEALGTTYHIKYFSENEFPIEEDLESIFETINVSMSTYREDSDISRINRGDSLVKVDTMFQKVFSLSQQVFGESDGYFDPTVGDLVNMYGFGPEKGIVHIDSSTVDSLMEFVGLEKIRITEDGSLKKDSPQVYLDFNAIAKGYAVDVIGFYLDKKGVKNYLIELGGELLAKGQNISKQAPWTVGIDDPRQVEGNRTLIATLELKDRAMATSGNYRKTRIDSLTGQKYVHTINPRTGYPEKSNLLSASVLAENCALADAYATAFMAMGLEKSKELLGRLEAVDAFLIYSQPDGQVSDFATEGFREVMGKP